MASVYVATTGNDSTGNGTSGNPYLTLAKAASVAASGDVIHMKAGSYSITGTTDNANGNVVNFFSLGTSNVVVKGYTTTTGDADGTTSTPVTILASGISNTYLIRTSQTTFQNIKFDGASLTGVSAFSDFGPVFTLGCAFHDLKEGANGTRGGTHRFAYFKNAGTAGGTEAAATGFCSYCVFDGCPDCCIAFGRADHCMFINTAGTSGIVKASDAVNCTFWNNSNSNLFFPFSSSNRQFLNNVLWNNSSSGGTAMAQSTIIENTACPVGATFDAATELNRKTLTADPFANSAATVTNWATAWAAFALNSTAGGGAVCRGAGSPLYVDIGAAQHQDAGGGGTVIVIDE